MTPERMSDVMHRAKISNRELARDLNMGRNGHRRLRRMKDGGEPIVPHVAKRIEQIEDMLKAGEWWV